MNNTADFKEYKIKRWNRLAAEAIERLTAGGLGEVRIFDTPDSSVRTAVRREAKRQGVSVRTHIVHGHLFVLRADRSDPSWVSRELTDRELAEAMNWVYSDRPLSPQLAAKQAYILAHRDMHTADWV